jgi:hypothetical protein
MAISITRYVDITSGVGAGTVVPTRDLVARIFTANDLVPPQSFISFTSASAVGQYFGTSSEEYYRAVFYFGFISKNVTQAGSIQYARWVNAAVAPRIYALNGNNSAYTNWTSITSGSFILTMGTYTYTLSSLDFSAVLSLADVATIIQGAIQAQSGGGTLWTSATVTYDATSGGFDLVGGATGDAAISVAPPISGTDITPAGLLGWLPQSINTNGSITPGAIWAIGSDVETISETLTTSNQISNNFGSFTFLTNLDLTIDQIVEAASWNYALNNIYMYSVGVLAGNVSAWQAALADIGGVGLTLSPTLSPLQYPEMCPMVLEAATDYTAINAVQNYSFQTFNGLTPSVTTDSDVNAYNALGINYYGQTQTAGSQIEFYQQGVLQGPPTSPLNMGVYVNEIWLKDAATAAIATLLLAQPYVPANTQGQAMILGTLQSVIQQALNNGTISVGKTLTTSQQMYVTSVTGDPNAWRQVQTDGYWLNCVIVPVGDNYEAQYVLVYSKNDVINFVEGTHILI